MTWWNELPDDDYRKRCYNAFVKSTNALHEFESLPEQVKRQINAISEMFGEAPANGLAGHSDIDSALRKISYGTTPYEFGEFVVVALLRPLLMKVNDDIRYYQERLNRCQGLDDDTRRETYNIITRQGTYKKAKKHLALCKELLQRYGNGITGDVDSTNLQRANLSDTVWNRLLEEDAAIKANNGQVKEQVKNACKKLGETLAVFRC